MSTSANECSRSAFISAKSCWCSAVQIDELNYTWKVDNFSLHEELNESLKSPSFSVRTNDEYRWRLELDSDSMGLHLYLFMGSIICERLFAKLSFSMSNNAKHEIYSSDFQYREFQKYNTISLESTHEWRNFLKKNEAFYRLIPNDSFTISLQIMFRGCDTAHLQYYSDNFASILEDRKFSDFTLSVQGKDYPVHKVILAARSNYFARMFESGMKENELNRVEITDVKEDVMDEMLKFIYTGKCENVDKLADRLLAAADKYDIDQLKRTCLETISKSISVDNAPNLLVLADLYHEIELKSKVIDFILTKSDEIKNSRAWNSIMPMYPKLLNEVCNAAFSRLSNASGSGDK